MMKRQKNHILSVIISLIFFVLLAGCTSSAFEPGEVLPLQVTEVIDGDTLKGIVNGQEETIRLLLIDTPETVHPSKPEEPFGKEASEFVKNEIDKADEIYIEIDTTIRDKYDRFLAYVWVEEKMLNELLIAEGLARVAYVYEPNTRYVDMLRRVEKEAKRRKVGIWEQDGYVTSNGFHPEVYQEISCDEPTIKGNRSSRGDWIYHTPSSPHYKQTIAEEMFCTEQEAQNAGYRPIRP